VIDDRLEAAMRADSIGLLEFSGIPAWHLLCYLADHHGLMLHGTGDPNIEVFEPRQSTDANPFGAQSAVYAASDGIWPMYYAILDRDPPFSLHNACCRILDSEGRASDPVYFFSIEKSALARRPFRSGFVYLLPRETFVQDPQSELGGIPFRVEHWASTKPVRPIAKVPVEPTDFPFLDQMRGHDDSVLFQRIKDDPQRFPWVDEQY